MLLSLCGFLVEGEVQTFHFTCLWRVYTLFIYLFFLNRPELTRRVWGLLVMLNKSLMQLLEGTVLFE